MKISTAADAPNRARGRTALRWTLYVAAAGLLAFLAWQSRDALKEVAATTRPAVFAAAVVAGLALSAYQGVYFWHVMRRNGSRSSLLDVLVAFLVSQPGKYVPGKIWAPLMQKASLGSGSSLAAIGASNVEMALITLIQMFSLGGACIAFRQPAWVPCFVGLGVLASAAILRTRLTGRIIDRIPWLAARLGPAVHVGTAAAPGWVAAAAASTGLMALLLLTSWLVLEATGLPYSLPQQSAVLGTLFLGFGSSLLAVPVPAGLGVREAATAGIGLLTAPDVPNAALVAVTLFARAWQLLVDGFCLAAGLAIGALRGSARS